MAITTKLRHNVTPLQSELIKKFGVPNYGQTFRSKNITRIKLPYVMWMDTIKFTSIDIHKTAAESLSRILNYVWEANDKDYNKIKSQGLHVFSGSWNIRHMRGGSTPSTHSWALALDINAPHNGLGAVPGNDPKSFTKNSLIVKAFEEEGWTWGGHWRRPDGMHFQYARVG